MPIGSVLAKLSVELQFWLYPSSGLKDNCQLRTVKISKQVICALMFKK